MRLSGRYYLELIYGKLAYLYGSDVARKLLEKGSSVRVTFSTTGRPRHIYVGDKLVFTLRNSDGYLLPTLAGAEYVKYQVIVREDAVPYVRQGRSVIAKTVVSVSQDARPGYEVKVTSPEGEVLAVGRLILSLDEVRTVLRGAAVKVRDHVGSRGEHSS